MESRADGKCYVLLPTVLDTHKWVLHCGKPRSRGLKTAIARRRADDGGLPDIVLLIRPPGGVHTVDGQAAVRTAARQLAEVKGIKSVKTPAQDRQLLADNGSAALVTGWISSSVDDIPAVGASVDNTGAARNLQRIRGGTTTTRLGGVSIRPRDRLQPVHRLALPREARGGRPDGMGNPRDRSHTQPDADLAVRRRRSKEPPTMRQSGSAWREVAARSAQRPRCSPLRWELLRSPSALGQGGRDRDGAGRSRRRDHRAAVPLSRAHSNRRASGVAVPAPLRRGGRATG